MPKLLFVTFPNDDLTLSYLSSYEKEVFEFAERKGLKVVKFERNKAARKNVESFLDSNNPGLVVFNGHGDEDSVCGYRKEPIIVKG